MAEMETGAGDMAEKVNALQVALDNAQTELDDAIVSLRTAKLRVDSARKAWMQAKQEHLTDKIREEVGKNA